MGLDVLTMPKLKVAKSNLGDTSREIIRVHEKHRRGLARHDIVRVSVEDASTFVTLLGAEEEGEIKMDLDTRLSLGVMYESTYDFTIELAGKWGELRWYLKSDNPSVRISAWLALWSVLLGAIGAIFGVLALMLTL